MRKLLLYSVFFCSNAWQCVAQDTLFSGDPHYFDGIYNTLVYTEGQKVRNIHTTNLGQFNDSIALMQNLEEIIDSGNDQDYNLKIIPEGLYSCTKLKTLKFIRCEHALAFSGKIAQLQSLRALQAYVEYVPKGLYLLDSLQELNLSLKNKDSISGIPGLKRLTVNYGYFNPEQGVFYKDIENFRQLEYLECSAFNGINKFKTVKELNLRIAGGQEQYVKQLAGLTQLETLYMQYEDNQWGSGRIDMSFLKKLTHLKKLVLIHFPVMNQDWVDSLIVEKLYADGIGARALKNKNIKEVFDDQLVAVPKEMQTYLRFHYRSPSWNSESYYSAKNYKRVIDLPAADLYFESHSDTDTEAERYFKLRNVKAITFRGCCYSKDKQDAFKAFLQNNDFERMTVETTNPDHLLFLLKNCRSLKTLRVQTGTTEYFTTKEYALLQDKLKKYKNKTTILIDGPDKTIGDNYYDVYEE